MSSTRWVRPAAGCRVPTLSNPTGPAVENTLNWLGETFGVVTVKVPVPLAPYTDAAMLASLEATLAALPSGPRVRAAVLDHISSKPALLLPAAAMVWRHGQRFQCD